MRIKIKLWQVEKGDTIVINIPGYSSLKKVDNVIDDEKKTVTLWISGRPLTMSRDLNVTVEREMIEEI